MTGVVLNESRIPSSEQSFRTGPVHACDQCILITLGGTNLRCGNIIRPLHLKACISTTHR